MKNLIVFLFLFLGLFANAQTQTLLTVSKAQSDYMSKSQAAADIAAMNLAIKLQARKTYVDSALTSKANISALTPLATTSSLNSGLASKQNILVSGTNIKTIAGVSVLGSGDLPIPLQVQNSMLSSTTLAPTATAVINYVTFMPFAGKTAAYTLLGTDYCVTLTTGSATFTLPSATALTGKEYVFKNKSVGVLTVAGAIDSATNTTRQFTTQNTGMRIISNGATWDIIGLF